MELVLIKLFQQLEVSKIQNNTDYWVCSAGTCIKSFKWQYLNTSCNVQNGRRHNAQMNIHLTYNRINSWNEREIACTILHSGNTYSSTQNKRLIHKSGMDICVGFDICCCVVYVTIAVVVFFLFLVFGIKLRARNKKEVYLNKDLLDGKLDKNFLWFFLGCLVVLLSLSFWLLLLLLLLLWLLQLLLLLPLSPFHPIERQLVCVCVCEKIKDGIVPILDHHLLKMSLYRNLMCMLNHSIRKRTKIKEPVIINRQLCVPYITVCDFLTFNFRTYQR